MKHYRVSSEYKPVNYWVFYAALLAFTVAPFAFGIWLAS